jgi:hypothetical protein
LPVSEYLVQLNQLHSKFCTTPHTTHTAVLYV